MKDSSKRTISRIVAFVMLVTCMFSNIMITNAEVSSLTEGETESGSAVDVTAIYTFDATDLSTAADKEALTQDEVDSYFTVVGTIQKRGSTSGVTSVEIAKNDGGQFTFTTVGSSSDVAFDVSSTGTSNTSTYALVDSTGAAIVEGEVTGASTGRTTVTATGLEAGTYSVTSPDGGYNRGARIYTITVIDGGTLADAGIDAGTDPEEESTEATTVTESTETTTSSASAGEGEEVSTVAVSNPFWLDDVAYDVEGVDDAGEATVTKTVEPGSYVFDDGSVVTLIGNGDTKFTPSWANGVGITRAGKVVNGYKAGNRHATANAIPTIPSAGDGTCVEFTPTQKGMVNVYFASSSFLRCWDFDSTEIDADGNNVLYGYTDSETAADNYAVSVEVGHTYVFSTTGKTNNMVYAGVEYIPDEPVTVSVSENNIDASESSLAALEIYFTDAALNTVTATVKADTTSLDLYKGHTYVITTNDGGVQATISGSDTITIADDTPIVIDLEDIPDVTLTGTITGTPVGTVESLTFTNMVNGAEYAATVTDDTYSVVMKPGEYNASVVTTNGGVTYDRASVQSGVENVDEVYVEVPVASGSVTYSPDDIALLETTGTVSSRGSDFTAKPDATVTIPVSGVSVVTVNSYYAAEFTITGANGTVSGGSTSGSTGQIDSTVYTTDGTETSITITFGGSATSYLTSIDVVSTVTFTSEISVPGDYDTLGDAIAAINAMSDRPEGEEGRVTINLTADLQEQVVIDAPYVTLQGNGHEINWYYGVGTLYYSIDSTTGLYSERLFRDKYSSVEGDGNLWGGVVIVRGDYFIAENTIFKNTYNYEITDKELSDIAGSTIGFDRTASGADPTVKAAKERSNAFYIDADNIEVYNCQILSSQDTLGRNGSTNYNYHAYFKDTVIGGNTDYICGEFSAVFDNCELQWKSYADDLANNLVVGYIVAPKTSPYVFRSCTVTTDGASGDQKVTGLYGRTWGSNSNAAFINTETNGHITTTGWGEMSSGDLDTATFYEYNNTSEGYMFDITDVGQELTDELIAAYIDDDTSTAVDTVLNGWTPVHYEFTTFEASTETTTEATTESTESTEATTVDPVDEATAVKFVPSTDYGTVDDSGARYIYKNETPLNDDAIEVKAYQDLQLLDIVDDATLIENAGKDYTMYAVTTSSNTTLLVPDAEKASSYRIGLAITAKKDITVTIDNKVARNSKTNAILKNIEITGVDSSGNPSGTAEVVMSQTNDEIRTDVFAQFSFGLHAGETYYFAGQGTNPMIYAVMYEEGIDGYAIDEEESTEESTESTTESTETTTSSSGSDETEATTEESTETSTDAATETTTEGTTPTPSDTGLWGDVNDDDVVNAQDAALVIQYVLNNATAVAAINRADVNADGVIDSEDAAMILQRSLDSTYPFPVDGTDVPSTDTDTPTLYVVGDSTACHYDDSADANYYYKRVGFGDKIADYADLEVVNLALSGRSSKSFVEEANYATLESSLEEGDILLIAFGHNDEKIDDATRYTSPGGTKDTEGSFKNSLYVNYVQLAQSKGATPILCSPIVRRATSTTWSANQLHQANDGDYANDVKELAEEVGVEFIDLTYITKAKYDELTPDNTVYLHAWTNSASTSVDNTHVNNYGAKEVAYLIATNATASLLPYIKAGIVEPTTADLVVNPNYVEASGEDLTGEDLVSVLWNTTSPWYGTVFGDIGGEGKLYALNEDGTYDYTTLAQAVSGTNNFAIDESADGSVNIRVGLRTDDNVTPYRSTTYGKISSTTDGLAMYYQPVDVGTNFSISATAHVNGVYNVNNQTAFGAIVADSILVDKYDAIAINNYVAASPLKMVTGVGTVSETTGSLITAWGGYARIDGTLTQGDTIDTADGIPQPGDDINVKITKVGNVYTVEYGTYVSEFTVDMEDVVYVGFFAARNADITFSNINYNNEVTE